MNSESRPKAISEESLSLVGIAATLRARDLPCEDSCEDED